MPVGWNPARSSGGAVHPARVSRLVHLWGTGLPLGLLSLPLSNVRRVLGRLVLADGLDLGVDLMSPKLGPGGVPASAQQLKLDAPVEAVPLGRGPHVAVEALGGEVGNTKGVVGQGSLAPEGQRGEPEGDPVVKIHREAYLPEQGPVLRREVPQGVEEVLADGCLPEVDGEVSHPRAKKSIRSSVRPIELNFPRSCAAGSSLASMALAIVWSALDVSSR